MAIVAPLPLGQVTFRDTVKRLCPRWLQGTNGEKLIYAMAIMLDGLIDATAAAIRYRFPGDYSPQSLPHCGRDRRMSRGRVETDDDYARRLASWLDAHAHRGGPPEMLRQLRFYFGSAYTMAIVNYHGLRFSIDPSGVLTTDTLSDWLPDYDATHWARWWLFINWPTVAEDDGIWDDPGVWSDGGFWDSQLSDVQVRDLQVIPTEWNAKHILWGHIVLLHDPDTALWDYPPGLWDEVGDTWETSRPASVMIGQ
jgi:hypothetical protein